MSEENSNSESEQTSSEPEAKWKVMDDLPGPGDPPDFFDNNKFKTLADQAKAAREQQSRADKAEHKLGDLQKEIDEKFKMWTGSPEEYPVEEWKNRYKNVNLEKEGGKEFLDWSKKNNLHTDYAEAALCVFDKMMDNHVVNHEKEIEKLGDDGKEKFNRVSQWLTNNLGNEKAPQVLEALNYSRAEVVDALNNIRTNVKGSMDRAQPDVSSQGTIQPRTLASLREEISKNAERYNTDMEYRKSMLEQITQARLSEGK